MSIRFHYGNALTDRVGEQHGIDIGEIENLRETSEEIQRGLRSMRQRGMLGFYDLPADRAAVRDSRKLAKRVRDEFENFVVLGIGGSALGPLCVHTALAHPYHNLLDREKRGGAPRMFFLDNPDPEWVGRLGEAIDLRRTYFSVVSKSGSTPETLAQLMGFHSSLSRRMGQVAADRQFGATTDPQKGPLLAMAKKRGWDVLQVPPNVGGRFSVLSSVGLLPAAVQGVPLAAMLKGAEEMEERCRVPLTMKNPAYLYAMMHWLADTRRGKSIAVVMPYANALRDLADWHRQLWAESLGKAEDVTGQQVFVGQTPVKALGATDQHSQVQLYTEGPNDKIFTFVGVDKFRRPCAIPRSLPELEPLSYLYGQDMGVLLNQELRATEFALAKARRPTVRLQLDRVSPENLGGLFMFFQIATAFAGGLYKIDAFNQPGVEEGKQATAALMGRDTEADRVKRAEIQEMDGRGDHPWV